MMTRLLLEINLMTSPGFRQRDLSRPIRKRLA